MLISGNKTAHTFQAGLESQQQLESVSASSQVNVGWAWAAAEQWPKQTMDGAPQR